MFKTLAISEQKLPLIGLGTWQGKPEETENAVTRALELGYRHIDTAFNYNNEEAIGAALKKWIDNGNGTREDLFITTKLPHIGNRPEDVERFLKLSLDRLQLEYVDLYLIHMPFGFVCNDKTLTPLSNEEGEYVVDLTTNNVATWKKLEEMVEEGYIKNIGLSNFNLSQILKIYLNAKIKPAVLQIELHANLQQKDLRKVCQELNIAVTAYSPLGSPGAQTHFLNKYDYKHDSYPDLLGNATVLQLAEKYDKTPAQILLRHLTQQNIVVIPKSSNPDRIQENFDIFNFDLTAEDLEKLNGLDHGENGRIFNFLFFKGIEKHPEYPFHVIENE